jgi:N utilization substance protein B
MALDVLYQADVTHADPAAVLAEWEAAGREIPEFSRDLVHDVALHLEEIDRTIGAVAEGWRVDRMPSLDRTILRIATAELILPGGVPPGAAIDEAVRAAKQLSTEDSGRFVNGVLGEIARTVGSAPREPG